MIGDELPKIAGTLLLLHSSIKIYDHDDVEFLFKLLSLGAYVCSTSQVCIHDTAIPIIQKFMRTMGVGLSGKCSLNSGNCLAPYDDPKLSQLAMMAYHRIMHTPSKTKFQKLLTACSKIPEFQETISDLSSKFFAVEGGIIIKSYERGFWCGIHRNNTFHLWLLGVYPEYRHSGLSKDMIDDAVQTALNLGYQSITADANHPFMIQALQSCNFKNTATTTHPVTHTVTHTVMYERKF
jgi:hypothetical protein